MNRLLLYLVLLAICSLPCMAQMPIASQGGSDVKTIEHEIPQLGSVMNMDGMRLYDSPVRYDSAGLDSFIRFIMTIEHFPGVATWCSKKGQVVWQRSFGYANLEDSIPVTDTTSFLLASISKTFTATAIMQLWERGLFNLDDDINDYLSFEVHNPYYPDSAITFRMLMTHTSTIHDNWGMLPPWQIGDHTMPLSDFVYEYLVPGGTHYSIANFNDTFPGVYYDYCNAAIALLGYLVEVIEDSFPVHCQDSIFRPLEMNHTSWFLAGMDTNNIARRYEWSGGNYIRYPHSGCAFYPSAQLRASAGDIARHLTAIENYGAIDTVRILDSATVDQMRSIQYSGSGITIGLTWFRQTIYGRLIWCHGGGMTGVSTLYGFCPAESSAAVVLINRGSSSTNTHSIVDALFDFAAQLEIEERRSTKPIELIRIPIATIFHGSLQLPAGMNCKVFDITGREVKPHMLSPGIYFIEIDGVVTQKVVKVR